MKNINSILNEKKISVLLFSFCLFLLFLAYSFSENYIILGDKIYKRNDLPSLKGLDISIMINFFGMMIPLKKFIAFISFFIFISIYLFLFKQDSQIKKMVLKNNLIKLLLEFYK